MKNRIALLVLMVALTGCTTPFTPFEAAAPTSAPAPQPTNALPQPTDTPLPASATGVPGATSVATEMAPTTSGAPTPAVAQPSGVVDDPARIEASEPEPRDQIALAEAFKNTGDIPQVVRTTPLDVKVGDVEQFWVSDFETNTNYQVSARLEYIGPIVLMYVDTTMSFNKADLEQSAKEFEQRIYPRDRQLFGEERSPGIDGDPRLTILNTALNGGAAGYFSGADGVPKAANRFSNEREMFVMGINVMDLGGPEYSLTLAHEFQHMIEANVAPRSPSWFNEGMSMMAQDLNDYVTQSYAAAYLPDPDVQITDWTALATPHYGASQLFLRYFYEQYAGDAGLRELIDADAGDNVDAFATIAARKQPDLKSFADVYADWAVANILNDPSVEGGRYAYQLLADRPAITPIQQQETTTVHQFGVDYYGELNGPLTISFDGADTVGLTSATPHTGQFMWWSNRGDDSISTLTRAFDLRNVQKATLQFAAWYEIELNYDYGFVGVSTDNGKTWQTLRGNTTTDFDPQGANYGNGLTGISGSPNVETDTGTRGQWVDEQMDLSAYAGQQILLRFWLIQDTAVNEPNLLIDDIRIPELKYSDDAEGGDGGWQAEGFVRTTGQLPQTWALRLVRTSGTGTTVETIPVDGEGRATVQLGSGEKGMVAVIGTTPITTESAEYSYSVANQ